MAVARAQNNQSPVAHKASHSVLWRTKWYLTLCMVDEHLLRACTKQLRNAWLGERCTGSTQLFKRKARLQVSSKRSEDRGLPSLGKCGMWRCMPWGSVSVKLETEKYQMKKAIIGRITGRKVTKTIPISRLVAPEGAHSFRYWDEARKKNEKWEETMVRWAERRQGSNNKGWWRSSRKIEVNSACAIGDACSWQSSLVTGKDSASCLMVELTDECNSQPTLWTFRSPKMVIWQLRSVFQCLKMSKKNQEVLRER